MFPRGAKLSGPDDNLGFAGVIFINSYSTRSCIVHFGFDTGQAELNVDFIMPAKKLCRKLATFFLLY